MRKTPWPAKLVPHLALPCHGALPRSTDRHVGLQAKTNEGRGELAIYLETVTGRFTHKNPVLVIHTHAGWPPEILFPLHAVGTLALLPHLRIGVELLLSPLGDRRVPSARGHKGAISIEDLQPVVEPVGHVDNTIVVHSHTRGTTELTLS